MERTFSAPNNQPSPNPTSFCLFSSVKPLRWVKEICELLFAFTILGRSQASPELQLEFAFFISKSLRRFYFILLYLSSHFTLFFLPLFFLSLSPASAVSPGLEMNAEQAEAAGVTVAKAGVIVFSSQLPSNDVWMWITFRVPEPLLRISL